MHDTTVKYNSIVTRDGGICYNPLALYKLLFFSLEGRVGLGVACWVVCGSSSSVGVVWLRVGLLVLGCCGHGLFLFSIVFLSFRFDFVHHFYYYSHSSSAHTTTRSFLSKPWSQASSFLPPVRVSLETLMLQNNGVALRD